MSTSLSLPFLPHPFLSPFSTTSLSLSLFYHISLFFYHISLSLCFLPHLSVFLPHLCVFSTTSLSRCFLPHLSLFFYHVCVFCHISFFVCLILHQGQIWCEITYTIWTQFRFKQSWETMWISFFTPQVFKHFGTLLYRIFFPSFCCELHP